MKFYPDKAREWRKKRNLTLEEIAKYLGKSFRTVSAWERGEREPSETDVRVLAQVLGIKSFVISDLEELNLKKLPYYYSSFDSVEAMVYDNLSESNTTKLELQLELKRKINSLENLNRRLKIENQLFTSIVKSSGDFVYVKNTDLKFTYANDSFYSLVNKDTIDLIGKSNQDIYDKDNAKFFRNFEQELLRGEIIENRKISFRIDSKKKIGLLSGRPLYNSIDNTVNGIIVSIKEITDFVQLEEKLKILEHSLDHIDIGYWVQKPLPNGKYQLKYFNKAFETLQGLDIKEIYRDSNYWKEFIHPDDLQRVNKYISENQSGNIDYRMILNNLTRWFRIRYYAIETEMYGKLSYGFYEDITQEKENSIKDRIRNDCVNNIEDRIVSVFNITDNKYVFFNKAHTVITGYPAKCFFNDPDFLINTVIHKDDIKDVMEIYSNNRDKKRQMSYRIICKNGEIKVIHSHLYPAVNVEGKLYFSTTSRVILKEEYNKDALKKYSKYISKD